MLSTPDLCDAHEEKLAQGSLRVLDPIFISYGGRSRFFGAAMTIKCFEDNSMVKEHASQPGNNRVMVVDGGGSTRKALLGDMIAANALDNGWAGFIFNGAIRDVEIIDTLQIGVRCLATAPVKTVKKGRGRVDIGVTFAGQRINPGDWVYADQNGILVSEIALSFD